MSEPLLFFAIGVWATSVAWRSDARRLGRRGAVLLTVACATIAVADFFAHMTRGSDIRWEASAATFVVVANGVLLSAVHEVMRPSPARMRAHAFDALVLGSTRHSSCCWRRSVHDSRRRPHCALPARSAPRFS